MRDTQRQKVYDAELAWEKRHPEVLKRMTFEEGRAFLNRLGTIEPPKFVHNKRMNTGMAWHYQSLFDTRIEFADEHPHAYTFVHEYAHHITTTQDKHGAGFTSKVVALVRDAWGDDLADDLAFEFMKHGALMDKQVEVARRQAQVGIKERIRERDGEVKQGFLIRTLSVHRPYNWDTKTYGEPQIASAYWTGANGGFKVTRTIRDAQVWVKRSTAEANAAKQIGNNPGRYDWYEIVEVEAIFDGEKNRFEAHSIVD